MISSNEIKTIGRVTKTHGIAGEMVMQLDYDCDPADFRCLIFDIDGIFVPFFVDSSRERSTISWLVKLTDITDDLQAAEFVNKLVYALRNEYIFSADGENDDIIYYEDLEGFIIINDNQTIGRVTHVDTSTDNTLFHVSPDNSNSEILIPAHETFITEIDTVGHTVRMSLPQGLIDLNKNN